MSESDPAPRVSVIVPVYNGGADLQLCLEGIYKSESVDFECIVVDDASTDGCAREAASTFGARYLRQEQQGGPAVARNHGARIATGGILFFTDADVVLHSDALSQAVELLDKHSEYAAVFGSYDDQPPKRSYLSVYRNLYHYWNHQRTRPEASTFWSGCGAIRNEVFTQMGGFNAIYGRPSIEDIELGYRLRKAGHRIRLQKTLQGQHLKTWTLGNMLKTDILARGVPWVELLQRFKNMPADLNLNIRAKLATITAGFLLPLLCVVFLASPAAILPFIALMLACLCCQALWTNFETLPQPFRQLIVLLLAIGIPAWLLTQVAWFGLLPLLLAGIIVGLQWSFYVLLRARHGLGFAMAAVPYQLLFFLGCAVAVPLGIISHWRKIITK